MVRPRLQRKPWALLAYTVADDRGSASSLDATAREELKAICDAADFGQLSVAAQVDFKRTDGVFRGSLTAPPPKFRGFETVRAEDHPLWRKILGSVERSKLRVQMERKDLNAARANVLQQFLEYGQRECPADRYVVYFYGHASGPMGLFYDADAGGRDPRTLRLNDLASSLRAVDGRAAVIVFRDCFMNTLEAAFQLRGVAEYMIATQALAPIAGVWPWLNFMGALLPGAATGDTAQSVVMQLAKFLDEPEHRGRFADVPYSLLDLGEADAIVEPLRALTDALESARLDSSRRAACAGALEGARVGHPADSARPGDPALVDVPTLCDGLAALGRDPVAAPARALGKVVGDRLVRWHHSRTGAHRGTSLYYKPVTSLDRERSCIEPATEEDAATDAAYYAKLALSEATGWHRVALNPLVE
jgi:hypothetical protein